MRDGGIPPEDAQASTVDLAPRRLPDFVSVTRGPGMRSNLFTGLDTAKGLAVAWQVLRELLSTDLLLIPILETSRRSPPHAGSCAYATHGQRPRSPHRA